MLNGSIDARAVSQETSSDEEQPRSVLYNLADLCSPYGSGVSEVPYLGQDDTSTDK